MIIQIINKPHTVEIVFNDYAEAFSASKLSIDKGSGNRLRLSPEKDYLHIVYAADGELVEISAPENAYFDSGGGIPFATMEALYDRLAQCMGDRTGAI